MGAVAITGRILAHAAITLAAMFVYAVGLFVGLQISPAAGTALWACAALVMAANVGWGIWWTRRWWKR